MRKILFLLFCLLVCSCSSSKVQEVETTLVKRGAFVEELVEEGEVSAMNSTALTPPLVSSRYGSMKIIQMVRDGKEVEKGDTLMVFDPTELKSMLVTYEQQLESARAELEKLKMTQQSEIEDLEADLESSRLAYEISKINSEQAAGYEAEVTRLESELRLETAAIALERAGEQIANRKRVHQEELVQKTYSVTRTEGYLREAQDALNNLFVLSPSRGIAIIRENWSTNKKWGVGDQPYSSSALIDLPDLSMMVAEVKVSEVDVSKLQVGQKVIIRPDAYSDTIYQGKVMRIANLATTKDYRSQLKVFPVTIQIEGQSRNLLPGLTVSCRIITHQQPDVLYIPLESLFRDEAGEYVYVRKRGRFERREVKTGAANADYAVVIEGIEEDEELALTDPLLTSEAEKGSNDAKGTSETESPR